MSSSSSKLKGKEKARDISEEAGSDSSLTSDSDSEDSSSDSTSDPSDSENEEKSSPNDPTTTQSSEKHQEEEEIIFISDLPHLPKFNPGPLPASYITLLKQGLASSKGKGQESGLTSRLISIRDPELEKLERATAFLDGPAPPIPPPELTKSGKPLTKKQRKELKHKTAGPDWFDLPAPSEADLPRLYREVEALRLRNQLDPKRFYKKEEGEGKGIKGLPKYFAIGTILPTPTPFATPSADNLTRAKRKRTLVDELVDDAEAKRYAKKKFNELQTDRGAKGRKTLKVKQAMRMSKW